MAALAAFAARIAAFTVSSPLMIDPSSLGKMPAYAGATIEPVTGLGGSVSHQHQRMSPPVVSDEGQACSDPLGISMPAHRGLARAVDSDKDIARGGQNGGEDGARCGAS